MISALRHSLLTVRWRPVTGPAIDVRGDQAFLVASDQDVIPQHLVHKVLDGDVCAEMFSAIHEAGVFRLARILSARPIAPAAIWS